MLQETAEQWVEVRKQKETYEARQKTLRDRLGELVTEHGETDEDGHTWIDLPTPVDDLTGFKWEKRTIQNLDEDVAETVLKKRRLLKSCQTTITVLDESKIEALYFQEKITDEEYAEMFPKSSTYALQRVTT